MGKSERRYGAAAHLRKGAAMAALALGLVPALSTLVLSVPAAQAFTGNANWAQQTPAASPSDLAGAAMAYDPAIAEMVLYGGVSDGQVSDSTYTYNGTAWTLQSPAASPPALSFASIAYDAALNEMVLFGGEILGSTPSNQTWFYNGATWTDADISGPSARFATSMAYDTAADETVLIGGLGPGDKILGDTWLLGSAGTWSGPYEPLAGGVYGAAIAYDPVISDVVLFGGVYDNGQEVENLTATFNTSTGWTPQSPSGSPPPVAYASMDYDPVLGDTVLFGGVASGLSGGTWGYDGTNWYEEGPTTSPSARAYGAMAFDQDTNRMVLYGGDDTTQPATGTDFGDTWVYGAAGTITQTGATSDTIFTGAPYILTGGLSVSGNTGAVTFTETTSSPTFSVEPGGLVDVTDVEPGSYTVSGTDSDAFGDTGTWTYTLNLIGSTLYVASGGTDNLACAVVDPCATLAEALAVAESGPLNGQAVTIDVGPGTYDESGDSIDASALASLTINGAGDTQTTVTTSNASGALLPSQGTVTISDLTISGAPQGILNSATLTLSDDTLSNDTVGLQNLGTADVVDDTFTQIGQQALLNTGSATVTNDTFAGDGTAVDAAAGASGATTLTDDTLSNDTTGIDNNATTSIANSILASAPCLGDAPVDGGYNVESDDSCALSPGRGDLVNNSHIELGSLAAKRLHRSRDRVDRAHDVGPRLGAASLVQRPHRRTGRSPARRDRPGQLRRRRL